MEVVILGPSNQAVIGTNRRAFIFKKGFMAGASFGAELTSWDYRNLVGVQLHTGMMSGAVILQGPGQSGSKTSTWRNKDDDPYKAPNAIPVTRPFDKAQTGVASLRQRIADAHAPSQPTQQTSPGIATNLIADELMKLAQLRDAGVLTEEEFAQQKLRLLG
ncbi:SHOCT domain-containing protein [Pedococcus ginsenosidimutans]|uniref:SHOCT domain-containing protein n=1 Tax=Pedococcus ginsenosidimutans TaxID=490570 RepID=UPI0031F1172D